MAKGVPFYKMKFQRSRYLSMGDPEPLIRGDLPRLQGWQPISKEKKDMWEDSKSVVDQKNKKREYMVTYNEPKQLENGRWKLWIEMLNIDKRGFTYQTEAPDIETLNREFWPVVEWLIAHHFAPRLRKPPELPVPDHQGDEQSHYEDAVNRLCS